MNQDIEAALAAWLALTFTTTAITTGLANTPVSATEPTIIAVAGERENVVSTLNKTTVRIILSTPSHNGNTMDAHRALCLALRNHIADKGAPRTALALQIAANATGTALAGLVLTGEESEHLEGNWDTAFVCILATK